MKLIEAEKVERITWGEPKHLHPKHVLTEVREKVRALPEVEAIPVEWIEKYTEENRLYQSDDFDLYIHDMIADWAESKEK